MIDWEAVERDYRTGKLTTRELGAKHGCSHMAVSKHARSAGWKQDLSTAVRQATDAALVEAAVSKGFQTTTETVLAVAELNKAVILEHRSDLRQARGAAMALLAELQRLLLNDDEKTRLALILVGGEEAIPKAFSRAREAVAKLTALPTRIAGVKALAEALTKLQIAERTAFGLDDKAGDREIDKPLTEALRDFVAGIHQDGSGRAPVVPLRSERPQRPATNLAVIEG